MDFTNAVSRCPELSTTTSWAVKRREPEQSCPWRWDDAGRRRRRCGSASEAGWRCGCTRTRAGSTLGSSWKTFNPFSPSSLFNHDSFFSIIECVRQRRRRREVSRNLFIFGWQYENDILMNSAHSLCRLKGRWIRLPNQLLASKWLHL